MTEFTEIRMITRMEIIRAKAFFICADCGRKISPFRRPPMGREAPDMLCFSCLTVRSRGVHIRPLSYRNAWECLLARTLRMGNEYIGDIGFRTKQSYFPLGTAP